jgi:medium-chain acyl-[acyl-carrier-protein] hydrolase
MTSSSSSVGWLTCPRPNPEARLRLFCFPYAGGGTMIYRRWPSLLPPNVEVCLIQLPGRETRFREPPYTAMEPLVRDLAAALLPSLDRPFTFFGHSMGALISFELTRFLRRQHGLNPVHLFVSGRGGPQFSGNHAQLHQLSDSELREELRRLKGTPREVIDNEELMRMFLPGLRADFTLVETYAYMPEPALDCPISAFGGLEDDVWPRERLEGWCEQTRASFRLRMLPGNHFFLNTAQPILLECLSQDLTALV